MEDNHWPAAFPCPECLQISGRAFKLASETPGKIQVSLRCRSCAHEWSLERETPTFAVRPRRDRRQHPRHLDVGEPWSPTAPPEEPR